MNTHKKLESVFGQIENSTWLAQAEIWKQQLPWKKYAQQIALEILEHLDHAGKSQKDFAAMMGVSPQLVNKWLKGNVNFTLETISKMEFVLGIALFQIPSQKSNPPMLVRTLPQLDASYELSYKSMDVPLQPQSKVVKLYAYDNDYSIAK